MPAHFQVEIDYNFTEICLEIIKNSPDDVFQDLVMHPAAQKIHAHALRFGNTSDTIDSFWKRIVDSSFNQEMENRIIQATEYLQVNQSRLSSLLKEVADYLPTDLKLQCTLYTMVGYDIGIVSEGSAFINVAHPFFKMNPCELIFMSMHEVHHVGYVHYNPIFALSNLKKLSDLKDAVRYLTHLEGLAVYAPLERRIESACLFHEDYTALLDETIASSRMSQYNSLVKELENTEDRDIIDTDFEIFEPMSATVKRLWYVTGASMAKEIDRLLGRDALVETIEQGPARFFAQYSSLLG